MRATAAIGVFLLAAAQGNETNSEVRDRSHERAIEVRSNDFNSMDNKTLHHQRNLDDNLSRSGGRALEGDAKDDAEFIHLGVNFEHEASYWEGRSPKRGLPQSQVAPSLEDPRFGPSSIFPPVPSCFSNAILVVYVQYLGMLDNLDLYYDMYGPHFREIEFYVDGTWCDPRTTQRRGYPCTGGLLNRSTIPQEVHLVDHAGGGWMMQRSLMNAVSRHMKGNIPSGFFFMADDVLLNLGQLTRAASHFGCNMIIRSEVKQCDDIAEGPPGAPCLKRFMREAHSFYDESDEKYRNMTARNQGSPSVFCMGKQNDFIYIPSSVAVSWAEVAEKMTKAGVVFTFAFYTAIFGIARAEDMVIVPTRYLDKGRDGPMAVLAGEEFDDKEEKGCWRSPDQTKPTWVPPASISVLVGMHVIHPNKYSSPIARNFALTLNPPTTNSTVSSNTSDEGVVRSMWCKPAEH